MQPESAASADSGGRDANALGGEIKEEALAKGRRQGTFASKGIRIPASRFFAVAVVAEQILPFGKPAIR
ncbi:hypothetical protein GCM10027564_26020 [Luteimonas notoginsengisoli]